MRLSCQREVVAPSSTRFIGIFDARTIVDIIDKTHYIYLYGDRTVRPKLAFYRRLIESDMLEDFLVIVPQPVRTETVEICEVGPRTLISRERRRGRGGKFGEMTDEKHRPVALDFVGGHAAAEINSLQSTTRGAMLLYVARESHPHYDPSVDPEPAPDDPERGLIAAFSVYVPSAALVKDPLVLRFRVRDASQGDAPTIDAQAD